MMKEATQPGITLNVKAPQFILTDIFDREINLESYTGKKVFIGFFRHAGCPFCNLRVHALKKRHAELKEKGLEMIFFFESGSRLLKSSMFHQEVSPIPLIADPERIWYQTYGIEQSMAKSMKSHLTSFIQTAIKAKMAGVPIHAMADGESITTMPAEFLLDENQIIRKIHYSNGLTDRMSMEHLIDFAEAT
ncbi:redoxin domain-containing protein [Fulvivirga sedimenti]|jgi:peroxiredoxin|uniref:Redoxin domain-containing protein n=1 Tax=Fulvivirga sedimenti TaxID=2879465 RepID=A0A9X1HWI5_9BACT|nr:redoxin domain-containing protein [Fulvivirga sedimenti]MCA6078353.1 redoxin domain-containing protein [Fulvivirga sedimenti]